MLAYMSYLFFQQKKKNPRKSRDENYSRIEIPTRNDFLSKCCATKAPVSPKTSLLLRSTLCKLNATHNSCTRTFTHYRVVPKCTRNDRTKHVDFYTSIIVRTYM